MNIEIFKRNIKLQELGIGKLSDKEQELLDFLNDNLTNLNTYTSDEYEGYLFFSKDKNNILLNYNEKNEYLYVSYDKIWSFLESKFKFNMKYVNIQEFIQWWVEDTLNLKINYTRITRLYGTYAVEGTFESNPHKLRLCSNPSII